MSNRVSELYGKCLKAKEAGIGLLYFHYTNECIDITVWLNGFDTCGVGDKNFEIDINRPKQIDEAIAYLTNAIKEKTPQGLASE